MNNFLVNLPMKNIQSIHSIKLNSVYDQIAEEWQTI